MRRASRFASRSTSRPASRLASSKVITISSSDMVMVDNYSWELISSYNKRARIIYGMLQDLCKSVKMDFTIMGVRFTDKPVEVQALGSRETDDKIDSLFIGHQLPTRGQCRVKVNLHVLPITDRVRSISEDDFFHGDTLMLDMKCYFHVEVVIEDLSPYSEEGEEDTFEDWFEMTSNSSLYFPVSFDDLDALKY